MVDYTQDDLTKWINEKAMDLAAGTVQKKMLRSDRGSTPMVGNLYFFKYDPKHKETLPMYDRYPMAFPIKMYGDGFLGLNMHWLPMGERKNFINVLNEYRKSEVNRPAINAEFIMMLEKSKKVYDLMPKAVHRYLLSYTKSSFIRILPEEYEKAVQLKIDEWVIKG